MKKSTLGLIVCLVIAVIVSIASVRSWANENAVRDANNLREWKRIEDEERIKNPYTGDCMREPPDPVPLAISTNTVK